MAHLANERDEAFCHQYVRTWKNRLASAAVGLSMVQGRELLKRPDIKQRITEINTTMLKLVDVTAERVMLELARVAFSDIRKIVDPATGQLLAIQDLDIDTAAGISGIDVETRYEKRLEDGEIVPVTVNVAKVRRYDKVPALAILARHFKIIGDDDAGGVNALANALADRLKLARQRMQALPNDSQEISDARIIQEHVQPVSGER